MLLIIIKKILIYTVKNTFKYISRYVLLTEDYMVIYSDFKN